MRRSIRKPLLPLIVFIGLVGLAGAAIATPAVGFNGTVLSRATLSESVNFNTGEVKLKTKGAVDITHQTITIDPGATSGWHTHPGVVLVTVKQGSLVRYDAHCAATSVAAGSAFAESGDHAGLVRNEGTTTVVVYVTYITPVGAALRVDAPNPGCPHD
jgi:quercetin dioxygenase-like cupin family protein